MTTTATIRWTFVCTALCLGVISVFAVPCLADETEENINASIEATAMAEAHYQAQEFVEAAQAYRKAYDLFAQPELLEKIAKAWEQAAGKDPSHCDDAENAWRDFLRVCGECDKKPLATRKVDDISRKCAQHRAMTTSAEDDHAAVQAPGTALTPGPARAPAWVGWTALGVGSAAVFAGGGLHLSAKSTADNISRTDLDDYYRDVDIIESREQLAWISYGVGAALITTAAILLSMDGADPVTLGPSGTTNWAWRF